MFLVKWGEALYCRKCHRQSPENFVTCAYCGAKLKVDKKKEPTVFVKKKKSRLNISFKNVVVISIAVAIVISLCAVVTAIITGSKPERVVKDFTKAIQNNNEKLYFSLYDEEIIEYKKDNLYFGDEETFENMVSAVKESDDFYTKICGEDYEITYSINSYETLSDSQLEQFNKVLESGFSYVQLPKRVDILNLEIVAEGEKGEYKSVYGDFYCMKIKGKWYKVDKTVCSEYEKIKAAS